MIPCTSCAHGQTFRTDSLEAVLIHCHLLKGSPPRRIAFCSRYRPANGPAWDDFANHSNTAALVDGDVPINEKQYL